MADNPNPNQVWVAMRHPDIPAADAAVVTLAAYNENYGPDAMGYDDSNPPRLIHRPGGWKLIEGSEASSRDLVDVTLGMPAKVAKAAEKGA